MPVPFKDLQPEWQQHVTELGARNAMLADELATKTTLAWGMFAFIVLLSLVILVLVVFQHEWQDVKAILIKIQRVETAKRNALIRAIRELCVYDDKLTTDLSKGILRFGNLLVVDARPLSERQSNDRDWIRERIASGNAVAFWVTTYPHGDGCRVSLSSPLEPTEFELAYVRASPAVATS